MRNRYRLEGLKDDQLLAALSAIVGKGNQVTADLLAHLAEVDERQFRDGRFAHLGVVLAEAARELREPGGAVRAVPRQECATSGGAIGGALPEAGCARFDSSLANAVGRCFRFR